MTAPTPVTRFRIPRALPVILLAVGGVWGTSGVVGLTRRVMAIRARAAAAPGSDLLSAPDPLLSPFGLVGTAIGAVAALALVVVGIRWLALRIDVGEAEVVVRRLTARTVVPLPSVKGVVLSQEGGLPQLKVVRRDGDPVVAPAWSLRAHHDDGEVEPAGPALQRLGATLGFGVKLRTLTGPVPPPDGPRGSG